MSQVTLRLPILLVRKDAPFVKMTHRTVKKFMFPMKLRGFYGCNAWHSYDQFIRHAPSGRTGNPCPATPQSRSARVRVLEAMHQGL
jgi:hypothetical protein